MTTVGLQLGAPGVYPGPVIPDRSLQPVRLDVAGFAGVAPRGPVDTPTLVRSWSEYQLQFGAFEGPGRLALAVSVFFQQGGERAYVVRVGRPGPEPAPETDPARALLELGLPAGPPLRLVAANPGLWGKRLTASLSFDATPQFPLRALTARADADPGHEAAPVREVLLPEGLTVPAGSLLRVRGTGMPPLGGFRWVESAEYRETGPGQRVRVAVLDQPLAQPGDLVAAI